MKKIILTALIAGFIGTASAVNINDNGDGQVLLSPYYTVQNGQATLISVVNSSADTKAIKVRFREAYNSRDVLDFNLYMSPFDVWTAKVMDNGKDGAKLVTFDNTCTVPMIPKDGVDFRPYAYDGQTLPKDGGPTDIYRVREGHFEIIEMGIADMTNLGPWDWNKDGVPASTHIDGVPKNCKQLTLNWTKPAGGWIANDHAGMLAPTGGLFGSVSIINVQTGTQINVPYTALDNFTDVSIHTDPGTLEPNMTDAKPISHVLVDGILYEDNWKNGVDAVSAVLMHDKIAEEYSVNKMVDAETSWIVTFPTKTEYVGYNRFNAPFSEKFDGKSCDVVKSVTFDREEDFVVVKDGIDFSPMPPADSFKLCYETNVIDFNGSSSVDAENTVTDFTTPYSNGWQVFGFEDSQQKMVGSENTYFGLPVIGFRSTVLGNKNVGIGASYATGNVFKFSRNIKSN